MKTSHEKPAIYERCHREFGVEWDKGVVITYGDTVYSKDPLTPDLEVHEATHIKQQAGGVEEWWERYFTDKSFRLSQEVEAYKNQLAYLKENTNRQRFRQLKRKIIKDMTTIYGGMCSEKEAIELLTPTTHNE